MKLIVGLGNPGKQYENTRHNAGFLAVDDFLREEKPEWEKKFNALFCRRSLAHDTDTAWLKPQTLMNESGKAVRQAAEFYKIDASQDLLVIHDDIDLPLGAVKPADNSSSAGHKGVQNIIDLLGTQEFHRLRIGIESRQDKSIPQTEKYVLERLSAGEQDQLSKEVLPKAEGLIKEFLKH
jgi:PTH1 family peptidyl-tRNA hydrolase